MKASEIIRETKRIDPVLAGRLKFALYDVFSSRPKRSTPKAKKCPVKAYFEAVRIVELTALSGDTELF